MVSTTALAGAPYETAKCLNKYSDIKVRWVAGITHYLDGRVFPADLLLGRDNAQIESVIREADVIHIQNDIPQSLMGLIQGKKLLFQVHSCPKRPKVDVLSALTKDVYTVLQPMQIRIFNLPGLPNLMDPEEYFPIEKTNNGLTVVFAPTNDWDKSLLGSKGEKDVLEVFKEFKGMFNIDFFKGLHYEDNLKRKQKADILIDDLVNNTFHKTSIEGCCFGLCVLTSACYVKGITFSTLDYLESNLSKLVHDYKFLEKEKWRSRNWAMTEWHPKNMVQRYIDAYQKVLQ